MIEKAIYHVYLKETDEHRYFGSKAAIGNALSKRKIGVEYKYLNWWFCTHPGGVFENAFCIIRKGELEMKPKSKSQ